MSDKARVHAVPMRVSAIHLPDGAGPRWEFFLRYSFMMAKQLKAVVYDESHGALMEMAADAGLKVPKPETLQHEATALADLNHIFNPVARNKDFKLGRHVPIDVFQGTMMLLEANENMCTEVIRILNHTQYFRAFRYAHERGSSYNGPKALKECITLNWSMSHLRHRDNKALGRIKREHPGVLVV